MLTLLSGSGAGTGEVLEAAERSAVEPAEVVVESGLAVGELVFGFDFEFSGVLPEPELGLLHVVDLEVLLVALHSSECRGVVELCVRPAHRSASSSGCC